MRASPASWYIKPSSLGAIAKQQLLCASLAINASCAFARASRLSCEESEYSTIARQIASQKGTPIHMKKGNCAPRESSGDRNYSELHEFDFLLAWIIAFLWNYLSKPLLWNYLCFFMSHSKSLSVSFFFSSSSFVKLFCRYC